MNKCSSSLAYSPACDIICFSDLGHLDWNKMICIFADTKDIEYFSIFICCNNIITHYKNVIAHCPSIYNSWEMETT